MSNINKNTNVLQFKNSTDTETDLYIYGDIVSSWWGAWDDTDQYPDKIRNMLANAKGKRINLHINSGGGSVFAGIAIYNMLKHHDGEVITYVDGIAASIASVIAFAGSKIVMGTGSMMMVHKPLVNYVSGNANDLRKIADELDQIQNAIMEIYNERSTGSVDISTLVNNETYLTASEVKEYFTNVDLGDLEAVACDSSYSKIPKQYNDAIAKKIASKAIAKAELELLKLKGDVDYDIRNV